MKLPFLQKDKWPGMKEPEERFLNQDEDKMVIDQLVDEVIQSLERKDSPRLRDSLIALIYLIRNEESNANMA